MSNHSSVHTRALLKFPKVSWVYWNSEVGSPFQVRCVARDALTQHGRCPRLWYIGFRHRLRDLGIGSGPTRRSRPKYAPEGQKDGVVDGFILCIFEDFGAIFKGFWVGP